MGHRRVGPGAVPVALSGLDMHNIARDDLTFFFFRRDHTFSGRDDQDLIAVVHMPAGGRTGTKVNDVTAKVIRVPIADDRLARAAHRPTGPAGDRRSAVHRFFRYIVYFDNAHDEPPA